ncbi:MAG: arylsulfotransferase family protein, partial [Planctomycetota bacterium]
KSNPPEKFFSKRRGSCQRLPNGNTLITESDEGRVFEITRGGETVWEFYEPEIRIKNKKRKRMAIYRMMRTTNPTWNYPEAMEKASHP